MAVNLNKKESAGAEEKAGRILVAMGWENGECTGKYKYDIDMSAFMLTENGRVKCDEDFVFYGNSASTNGAVLHTGSNETGNVGGDSEAMFVDFDKVPAYVERIAIAVTIYDGDYRRQNFGQLKNAYVRVADADTPQESLFRYEFNGKYTNETVVVACEFIRRGRDWKIRAVGSGFRGGMYALCTGYGVNAYV